MAGHYGRLRACGLLQVGLHGSAERPTVDRRTLRHQCPRVAGRRQTWQSRCKLAIHEQSAQGEVFEVTINKGGPRLKAAIATSGPPSGNRPAQFAPYKLKSGGFLAQTTEGGSQVKTYHGATMQDLAEVPEYYGGTNPRA